MAGLFNTMPYEQESTRRKPSIRLLATVIFLIALAFWLGLNVGYVQNRAAAPFAVLANEEGLPPSDIDFSPLWKTWSILGNKFVGTSSTTESLSNQDLLYGAIQGVTASYGDPYTVFLPPAESTTFAEDIQGSFGGVGIEIGMRDRVLTVIAPLKDSPGDRAGIEPSDRIVKIDGESTEGISVDKAVQLIRGDVGTTVSLTLEREGKSDWFTVDVVREVISIPTIDFEDRQDGVFVISLYNFSANSADLFRDAFQRFLDSPSDMLVLDLRNNPGGYLEAAVQIASWFVPEGKTVVTEDFGSKQEPNVHRSVGYGPFDKPKKMAVLVNNGSASASEILAGALREYGIAKLVGETTFGKGSVQELVSITPQTSLKVTVARWFTPDGVSISNGGLHPDIEVSLSEEGVENGDDSQLDAAIEYLVNEEE